MPSARPNGQPGEPFCPQGYVEGQTADKGKTFNFEMTKIDIHENHITLTLAFIYLFILSSCATYNVTTKSLVEQFAGSNQEKKGYFSANVNGNNLTSVKVVDNKGQEKIIDVSNRTQIRVTKVDSSRTTFYFNTLLLNDSDLVGSKTHFFNAQIKPIKIADILKIEILP